jgi:hypothetical protein
MFRSNALNVFNHLCYYSNWYDDPSEGGFDPHLCDMRLSFFQDVWKLNFGTIESFGNIPEESVLQASYPNEYHVSFLNYWVQYDQMKNEITEHMPDNKWKFCLPNYVQHSTKEENPTNTFFHYERENVANCFVNGNVECIEFVNNVFPSYMNDEDATDLVNGNVECISVL